MSSDRSLKMCNDRPDLILQLNFSSQNFSEKISDGTALSISRGAYKKVTWRWWAAVKMASAAATTTWFGLGCLSP